jgi:hypothetical protein
MNVPSFQRESQPEAWDVGGREAKCVRRRSWLGFAIVWMVLG